MADLRHPTVQEWIRDRAHSTGLDGWAAWADIVADATAAHTIAAAAALHPPQHVAWPDPEADTGTRRLALPERIAGADDALQTLTELWPVLHDALQPGNSARHYTRRAGNRARLNPWCEVCGARRWWRAPTWTETPPADYHGPERLRPYCRRCDAGQLTLPTTAAAAAIGPLDTLIAAEHAIADIRRALTDALGDTVIATDPGHPFARLAELLAAAARRRPLAHAAAERRLTDTARAVQATLRDVEPVIALDARCPWCNTLSLVMWPDRGLTNASNVAGLVACTYRACECELDTCRCHRRTESTQDGHRPHAAYRHQWTNTDWGWLSRRIDINLYDIARSPR